jgi:hypothetical protein
MAVLSVSVSHEHAECTVYVDRSAVVNVAVTPEHTAAPSKHNNYGAENWQHGKDFCGLFVSLSWNLLEKLRKITTNDLG